MRVWDVSPGYLNRQSLLGEHRELHGLYAILSEGLKGYSRHPETRRWAGALSGLAWRHAQLVAEMQLRGYVDRTPLPRRRGAKWPDTFVTEPADQMTLLRRKYVGRSKGRIPLPRHVRDLWAQHRYSVMARDRAAYQSFARVCARVGSRDAVHALARDLAVMLRHPPADALLIEVIEQMWRRVRDRAGAEEKRAARETPASWLAAVQALAIRHRDTPLLRSTALGELALYAHGSDD